MAESAFDRIVNTSGELEVAKALKELSLSEVKVLAEAIKSGKYPSINFRSFHDGERNTSDDLEEKLESICEAIEQASSPIQSISFPYRAKNTPNYNRIYATCRNGRFEELVTLGLAYGPKGAFQRTRINSKNQHLLSDERLSIEAAKNPNIKRVQVTFVHQDEKGRDHVEGLRHLLETHQGIESLHIGQTNKGYEEAAMAVIAANTTLKQFELGGGLLTDEAARKLSIFIENNPNLQEIKLGCRMSDQGWETVAEALKQRPEVLVEGHKDSSINTDSEKSPRAAQIAALTAKLTESDIAELSNDEIEQIMTDMSQIIWVSSGHSIISTNQVVPSEELDTKIGELLTQARFQGINIPESIQERYRDKLMGAALVPARSREVAKKDPLEGIKMDAETRAFVEDAQQNGLDVAKAIKELGSESYAIVLNALSAGAFSILDLSHLSPNLGERTVTGSENAAEKKLEAHSERLSKLRSLASSLEKSSQSLQKLIIGAETFQRSVANKKHSILESHDFGYYSSINDTERDQLLEYDDLIAKICASTPTKSAEITIPKVSYYSRQSSIEVLSQNSSFSEITINESDRGTFHEHQLDELETIFKGSAVISSVKLKLDLSDHLASTDRHNRFFAALNNQGIKCLDLEGSIFVGLYDTGENEVKGLVNLILDNNELEELNLSQCEMNEKQWALVTDAIKQRPFILVKGHPDPSFNTAEMTVHRERLLEVGTAIATQEVSDLDDQMITDALGSLTIIERALNAKSVLEIPSEHLPVDVDAKISGLLSQARVRGIDIPEAVQQKHADKLMGSPLVAGKGQNLQAGVLETMLRADKSIDMEVGIHNGLVASISAGIEAIIAAEKGTQEAHKEAKTRLKQAERDAERMDRKIDGMISVKHVEGYAAAEKRQLLDEADARLSRETAWKEQLTRGAMKALWEGGKIAVKAKAGIPPSLNDLEGVGNALGDMAANIAGENMRISDRRTMRGIEASVEADCRAEIIDILESQRIDVTPYRQEVDRLAKEMVRLSESKQIEEIRKDEAKQERIASGLLRQRLVKSGLDVCVELEKYHLAANDIDSIDSFLAAFKDDRLHEAVENLCYGRANSNDMEVMIAEANGFTGDTLKPHQKALKSFVEEYVKQDIDGFMTKASFVDAIDELNLLNLDTLGFSGDVDKKAPKPNSKGELVVSDNTEMSTKSRIALMSVFADEYGQRHIGNYYIQRLFRFWLTRHGDTTLVADEVLDGNEIVYNDLVGKEVTIQPEREMRRFTEAVKRGGAIRQDNMPMPDDLFLRVCGYEYYLPQAVRTNSERNKLSENPEAPIAYPMVNKVVATFVKNMVDGGLEDYQGKVGPRLDNVVAQSFIDFFAKMGRQHREQFALEREGLRTGYGHDLYTRKFTPHMNRITESALGEYDTFLDIYATNLEKYMQVVPESERAELEEQVEAVKELADGKLNPPIVKPGSHEDKLRAREEDRALSNTTENFGRRA